MIKYKLHLKSATGKKLHIKKSKAQKGTFYFPLKKYNWKWKAFFWKRSDHQWWHGASLHSQAWHPCGQIALQNPAIQWGVLSMHSNCVFQYPVVQRGVFVSAQLECIARNNNSVRSVLPYVDKLHCYTWQFSEVSSFLRGLFEMLNSVVKCSLFFIPLIISNRCDGLRKVLCTLTFRWSLPHRNGETSQLSPHIQ